MGCRFSLRWTLFCVCANILKSGIAGYHSAIVVPCQTSAIVFQNELLYNRPNFQLNCKVTGQNVTENQEIELDVLPDWYSTTYILEEIEVTGSIFSYIPAEIFGKNRVIRHLNMSNVGLVEMLRHNINFPTSLSWLTLGGNKIKEIKDYTFTSAEDLLEIDLSNNHITALTANSLVGLKSLRVLNLAGNQIARMATNVFRDNLLLLETLHLERNLIDHLDRDIFNMSTHLQIVDLSYNKLLDIDPTIFTNVANLSEVYLSHNELNQLDLYMGGDRLSVLSADYNELISFYVQCSEDEPCSLLKFLDLSYNKLDSFVNISRHPNLKQLILSYNNVGKLNVSTFAKLNKLERLDLRATNLRELTFGMFSRQSSLTYLDISGNSLEYLDLDIFLPYLNQHLEEFYLNGNHLSELGGQHTLNSFPSLKKLALGENRFNCSYLVGLLSFMQQNNRVTLITDEAGVRDERANVYGIECTNTASASKSSEKLQCENRISVS